MSANPRNDPARARDSKRARFAEEKQVRRGASPFVLAVGLLLALGLIAGAVLLMPRLASTAGKPPADAAVPAAGIAAPVSEAAGDPAPGSGQAADIPAVQPVAATHGHDPYPLIAAQNGAVNLPVSTFDDGKARFYTYMHEGSPIEFFVLKSKDGVLRAALNTCDVCFSSRLGYHQEGDEMVCNNCGSRFPSDRINDVRGGCNPSPLDRTLVGGSLSIMENDLIQGLSYFGN